MKKDLIKAYEEVEMLKSLDLPIPEEKSRYVTHLEDDYIKMDLIPNLQGFLQSIFENYCGHFAFTIVSDKGVQISEKTLEKARRSRTTNQMPPISHLVNQDDCFYLRSGIVDACAHAENGMIIVHKGSRILTDTRKSYPKPETRYIKMRSCSQNHGEYSILIEDIKFSSVSIAAAFCLGYPANGWLVWKTKNGELLKRT